METATVQPNTIFKYTGDIVCPNNPDFDPKLVFVTSLYDKADGWTGTEVRLVNFIFLSTYEKKDAITKEFCCAKHLFVGHSLPIEKFLEETAPISDGKIKFMLGCGTVKLNTNARVFFELSEKNYKTDAFVTYMKYMKDCYLMKQGKMKIDHKISTLSGNWEEVRPIVDNHQAANKDRAKTSPTFVF